MNTLNNKLHSKKSWLLRKNGIKYIFLLFSTFIAFSVHAQKFSYEWARHTGSGGVDIGRHIAVDDVGNTYTTGEFIGNVDFDPGPGVANLNAIVNPDIFILKLDTNGNYVWAKKMGWIRTEDGRGITIDNMGNVLTTGRFSNTVDFDPGTGIFNLTAAGVSFDIFIQKLDNNGNFIWAKRIGAGSTEYGNSIVTDNQGNIYVTGHFEGTVDFDPGPNSFNLISAGRRDSYVLKLDPNGNFLWVTQIGGIFGDEGNQIILDASGNIYSIGIFKNTVDFDPGPGIFNLSATSIGQSDVYIQKLDSLGNLIWAKSFGGTSADNGYAITSDTAGNIYTTGDFHASADLNPDTAVNNFVAFGSNDVFIQKLDSNGNYIWGRQIGGVLGDYGRSINVDAQGNVLTSGEFSGIADFDPSSSVYNLNAGGFDDGFIQMLDANGNFIWAKRMGKVFSDDAYLSSVLDSKGNLYSTGFFRDTVDFNPSGGVDNLISIGSHDFFIQKFSPCATISSIDSINACDSYTWINGITYTSSNQTAIYTLESSRGCDSTVSLKLNMNYSSSAVDTIVSCNSIIWIDGNNYSTSNNSASFTLMNSVGCDSIVSLDLTINSSSSIDTITTCDSVTWRNGITYFTSTNNTIRDTLLNSNGCDSVITLDLRINSNMSTDSIVACKRYMWIDGNSYTTSNYSAMHTLNNSKGCDSVVTLNLTIDSVSDVGIRISPFGIVTNNLTASAYQWLNCNNNYSIIPNETDTLYTPSQSGNYAVEITENLCIDTSTCLIYNAVGIDDIMLNESISISPNPNNGLFSLSINTKEFTIGLEANIYNIYGELVYSRRLTNCNEEFDLTYNVLPGLYSIIISGKNGRNIFWSEKIIIP